MTMTKNEIKKQIVMNLKKYHSGKWVNPAVAVLNIPEPTVFAELEELVQLRVLEQKFLHHKGHQQPLVRYIERKYNVPKLTLLRGGKDE